MKCQAAAGHCTLHVSYDSSSNRHCTCGDARQWLTLTEQPSLAIVWKQVIVNPETKAHVWVHEKVCNCTTADVCVLVDVTLSVCNLNDCTNRVDIHNLDTVRGTNRDLNEHWMNESKWTIDVLDDARPRSPSRRWGHSCLCRGVHERSSLCIGIQHSWYCGCRECILAHKLKGHHLWWRASPIAGQGNVSDAVSSVVKVRLPSLPGWRQVVKEVV